METLKIVETVDHPSGPLTWFRYINRSHWMGIRCSNKWSHTDLRIWDCTQSDFEYSRSPWPFTRWRRYWI